MSMIIAARHSLFLCSHSSFSLKYWNSASLTTNNWPSLRKMTTFLLAISHMQQLLKLALFIVSMVTGAVSVFAFLLAISDMQHTKVRIRRITEAKENYAWSWSCLYQIVYMYKNVYI